MFCGNDKFQHDNHSFLLALPNLPILWKHVEFMFSDLKDWYLWYKNIYKAFIFLSTARNSEKSGKMIEDKKFKAETNV